MQPEHRDIFTAKPAVSGSVVFGYAALFGIAYEYGDFLEEISPNAFLKADLSDVRALLNHDPNQILARTKAGTLKVGVDKKGLWYRFTLPDSPNGDNMRAALERGDVSQSSWGFTIALRGETWTTKNGMPHRMITEIDTVYDVSPVTYPANKSTSAALEQNGGARAQKLTPEYISARMAELQRIEAEDRRNARLAEMQRQHNAQFSNN